MFTLLAQHDVYVRGFDDGWNLATVVAVLAYGISWIVTLWADRSIRQKK